MFELYIQGNCREVCDPLVWNGFNRLRFELKMSFFFIYFTQVFTVVFNLFIFFISGSELMFLLWRWVLFCLFRFEHSKPIKKEELPNTQTLPLASVSQADPADPTDPADPEPRGMSPGSGAQDWVNAAEFVPGQPYCGRGEWKAYLTWRW